MSLEIQNLSKSYSKLFSKKPAFEAVKNLSFNIQPGEIYSLLGPNGAGKSTTIKMIAGLILPTSGRIVLDGKQLGRDTKAYKELSAVLEDARNVYWRLTPMENLYYFANLRGISSKIVDSKVDKMLKNLEIDGKKKNQSQHLSRGMLQKLALAAALITDPQIILLDEPTLGLDVESSRKIKDMILDLAKNHGKTILLTTHQMDLVEELADRVGIIRNGELVKEGSLGELRSVFKNFIYRIKIKGKFTLPQKWKLNSKARILQTQNEFTEVELDCKNNAGVYECISDLKKSKKEIITFQRVVDDLEENIPESAGGKMKMEELKQFCIDFLLILKAEIKRDFIFMKRYPLETLSFLFFMYLILLSILLGFSQLMASGGLLTGKGSPLNREKMIIGYCLMQFVMATQMGWSGQIQNESQTGTLEQLSISGHGLGEVLLARGISQLPRQIISFFLLIAAYHFTIPTLNVSFPHFAEAILVLCIMAFGIFGVSYIFAGLTLLFKRVGFFFQIINFAFLGLFWQDRSSLTNGGALALLYDTFPLTIGMKSLQNIFVTSKSITNPDMMLLPLVFSSIIFWGFGYFLFTLMEKRARNLGLLSQY